MVLQLPIAALIKRQARLHPQLRQMLVNLGQASHRRTSNIWRFNSQQTGVDVLPLSEEKAVKKSAEAIAEYFLLSIGGCICVSSFFRHEATKEANRIKDTGASKKMIIKEMEEDLENGASNMGFLSEIELLMSQKASRDNSGSSHAAA